MIEHAQNWVDFWGGGLKFGALDQSKSFKIYRLTLVQKYVLASSSLISTDIKACARLWKATCPHMWWNLLFHTYVEQAKSLSSNLWNQSELYFAALFKSGFKFPAFEPLVLNVCKVLESFHKERTSIIFPLPQVLHWLLDSVYTPAIQSFFRLGFPQDSHVCQWRWELMPKELAKPQLIAWKQISKAAP